MCIEFQADSRIIISARLCSLINLQAGGNFSDAVESVDDGIRLRFKYGRTPCYVREVISPEDAAWPGEDSVESVFEMGIEGREVVVGNDAWIEGVAADGDPEDLMGADRLDVLSDLGDLIGDFGEAFGFSHVVDGVYSSNPRLTFIHEGTVFFIEEQWDRDRFALSDGELAKSVFVVGVEGVEFGYNQDGEPTRNKLVAF